MKIAKAKDGILAQLKLDMATGKKRKLNANDATGLVSYEIQRTRLLPTLWH